MTRPHASLPESDSHAAAGYDIVIIGTGAAGMAAVLRASELGARAAIVERADVVGGTCVNVGCIPSKALVEVAARVHAARSGFPGVAACDPHVAWSEVVRQKDAIVAGLREEKYVGVLNGLERVTVLRGAARLLGPDQLQVGTRRIHAPRIVVATGARPAVPPIAGLAGSGALDSTTAMQLDRLPASMIVLGAGATGLELAQTFARFGVRVTIVEVSDRVLPLEDPAVSERLAAALAGEGVAIRTGARVTEIVRDAAGYHVPLDVNGRRHELQAEALLVATGRRPNTDGVGLDAAGVHCDARGFIQVDDLMRTSAAGIFAAGDVTGGPAYVYVAALEGGVAAHAALADDGAERPVPVDLRVVPRVVFTDPQVAAVGMTEAQASATGLHPRVTSLPLHHLARAAVTHRSEGMIALVADATTDRLLGAHIVAPHAGDMITEATLAIRFGLTTRDIVSTLHPYLTWAEGIKLAAQTFTTDVARLSCCA